MQIMAIGAHPDDLEIFMYGLLAAAAARGDNLHLVVATDGAAGGSEDHLQVGAEVGAEVGVEVAEARSVQLLCEYTCYCPFAAGVDVAVAIAGAVSIVDLTC